MSKFTFGKEQKLTKEKDIQELFSKGSSFYLYPFKVYFLTQAEDSTLINQVLISVSKRNFKRAVDRNLIKRRIREAYRLLRPNFPTNTLLIMAFVYTHKEILLFEEMKKRLELSLSRINKMLP